MSKDVTIQEGGIGRAFGRVQRLVTAKSGGGSVTWVPEAEVKTTSLWVSENGFYNPENDGVYGYDEVSVEVESEAIGTDEDGKKKKITRDKDTDMLVETELPTNIQITTLPRTINYVDGQDISLEGAVITAYYADGREWGVVDLAECTINPSKADASEASSDEAIDTSGIDDNMLHFPPAEGYTIYTRRASSGGMIIDFPVPDAVWVGFRYLVPSGVYVLRPLDGRIFWALSDSPFTIKSGYMNGVWDGESAATEIVYKGITYYYYTLATSSSEVEWTLSDMEISSRSGGYLNNWDTAYIIFNGHISVGGQQTITVSWEHAVDEPVLTTTYDITVGAGPIPPNQDNEAA